MDTTSLKSRLDSKTQALQSTAEAAHNTPALTESNPYLAFSNDALDIIRENLRNQPLSFQLFDLVKSPSGGSTVFSVPGLSGDEAEKELTGIILNYTTPRAYWDTPDPVEGTPPVCFSPDSIVSQDGKSCAHCPFNDYGSKDGDSNAKACKESVVIFLLRPNSIVPLLVRVPVTSKLTFLKYATRLISTLTPISSVVTKITLEKATSKAGKPYAQFHFKAVHTLSREDAAKARAYGQQFMEIMDAAEMNTELSEAG